MKFKDIGQQQIFNGYDFGYIQQQQTPGRLCGQGAASEFNGVGAAGSVINHKEIQMLKDNNKQMMLNFQSHAHSLHERQYQASAKSS